MPSKVLIGDIGPLLRLQKDNERLKTVKTKREIKESKKSNDRIHFSSNGIVENNYLKNSTNLLTLANFV